MVKVTLEMLLSPLFAGCSQLLSRMSNSAAPWTEALEKAMATHSSTLDWKIPWMEEPGRLQWMVSQRVEHYWATSLLVIPLDCKEIQPVHSEGDQPWDFFGRNDAKAETPVLWPPHAKSWLIGKDSDAGRDWGQEEKGTTEDEMAG